MPELPEVETVCRGLAPMLEGQVIARVAQRRDDLRFPLPADFAKRIEGRRVLKVERRAKFIFIRLDDEWVLIAHLGMSGRMVIHAGQVPNARRHDHIDIVTQAGTTVRYTDPRRFGFMDLVPAADLADHKMLRTLGPEPLSDDFSIASLSAALKAKKTPIKAALLDQKVVAGLGNIYACEALFRAAISPRRGAHTIPGRRAARLVPEIKAVLEEAVAAGGSSLRDYVQSDGELGYFQHNWRVYGREGEACGRDRCAGVVRRIVQSGRSTFYCPGHQR